jgi:predicted RNA-binding protein with RPS1 domain
LADVEAGRALRQSMTGLALEPLAAELGLSLAVLMDIVSALHHPDLDPRAQHHGPILRQKMRRIEDLQQGMWVKGVVRNVVDFGAFVDIGLKEDGLIHISQFSKRYVRNPLKFLHVGDVVDVRIVTIEADKHRIALTLIQEQPVKKPEARRHPPSPRAAAGAEGTEAAAGSPAAGAATHPPRSGQSSRRPPQPQDQRRQGRPQTADRRPPAAGARPASASPQGASAGGARPARPSGPSSGDPRSDKPRDSRTGRPSHDRRPPSGTPRVIVSKSKSAPDSRPADPAGRPRLRWAVYDSDPAEAEREEAAAAALAASQAQESAPAAEHEQAPSPAAENASPPASEDATPNTPPAAPPAG